jgi:hypothetical protein
VVWFPPPPVTARAIPTASAATATSTESAASRARLAPARPSPRRRLRCPSVSGRRSRGGPDKPFPQESNRRSRPSSSRQHDESCRYARARRVRGLRGALRREARPKALRCRTGHGSSQLARFTSRLWSTSQHVRWTRPGHDPPGRLARLGKVEGNRIWAGLLPTARKAGGCGRARADAVAAEFAWEVQGSVCVPAHELLL